MKNYRKLVSVLCSALLLNGCFSSSIASSNTKNVETEANVNATKESTIVEQTQNTVANNVPSEEVKETYELSLKISSEPNKLLAKYDLNVYIDNEKITTISNGGSYNNSIAYSSGSYTLKITNSEDESIYKEESINVNSDVSVSCSVKSHMDKIEFTNMSINNGSENVSESNSNEIDIETIRSEIRREIANLYEQTSGVISEDGTLNLVGLYLDDAIRVLETYGVSDNDVRISSDTGKSIVVKNNWEVIEQWTDDNTVYLLCTKVRTTGIIDAAKEVITNNFDSIQKIGNTVSSVYKAYKNVKYIKSIINDIRGN